MAGKPIQIEFISSIKDVLNKNKNLDLSFEDVADAIAETGKTSKKSMKQVIDGLDDVAKEAKKAEQEIDDLEQGAKRSFQKTGDHAKRAGRDLGDGVKGSKLGEVGEEVGQEFTQNLGEAFSSGSAEDIVSGSLGGLLASMPGLVAGPAGLAIGAAGALAVAWWSKFNEKQKEQQANVAQAMSEVLNGATNLAVIDPRAFIEDLYGDLGGEERERAVGIGKLKRAAEELGVEFEDVVDAVSTGTGAFADQLGTVIDLVEEQDRLRTYITQQNALGVDGLNTSKEQARVRELSNLLAEYDVTLLREVNKAIKDNNTSYAEAVSLNEADLRAQGRILEKQGLAVEGAGTLVARAKAYKELLEEIPEDQRKGNERAEELKDLIREAEEAAKRFAQRMEEATKNRTLKIYIDPIITETQAGKFFQYVEGGELAS